VYKCRDDDDMQTDDDNRNRSEEENTGPALCSGPRFALFCYELLALANLDF